MLERILSGGQTGADIGGVLTAELFGIPTGGTMPKGFLTLAGPKPEWAKRFGFVEHDSPKYPPRTYKNVADSDGTIRIAFDFDSAGERCTMKAISAYKKPYIDVDIMKPRPVSDVVDWIARHNIQILNVAGNSEKTFSGMTGETMEYLSKVFAALGFVENQKA